MERQTKHHRVSQPANIFTSYLKSNFSCFFSSLSNAAAAAVAMAAHKLHAKLTSQTHTFRHPSMILFLPALRLISAPHFAPISFVIPPSQSVSMQYLHKNEFTAGRRKGREEKSGKISPQYGKMMLLLPFISPSSFSFRSLSTLEFHIICLYFP